MFWRSLKLAKMLKIIIVAMKRTLNLLMSIPNTFDMLPLKMGFLKNPVSERK
uniref:Uncharacterized protein n=1 Tax=Sulfolobus tengchongensis TaxID=207809 RepID=Q6H0Y8_9CREN|nr:hypothetical protein [Sulfolobus tengchongensis]AAT46508.1 hypothetical protein [Sulfolobus tengchongensis]